MLWPQYEELWKVSKQIERMFLTFGSSFASTTAKYCDLLHFYLLSLTLGNLCKALMTRCTEIPPHQCTATSECVRKAVDIG